MRSLVVPLSAPEAADAGRFGPKAANLAVLGQAGPPVPGGYAVDAQAYRRQLAALDLEETARRVFSTEDRPQARQHALDMKLGLMERPVAPELAQPMLAAWRAIRDSGAQGVVRSSALVEDRAVGRLVAGEVGRRGEQLGQLGIDGRTLARVRLLHGPRLQEGPGTAQRRCAQGAPDRGHQADSNPYV